MNIVYIMEAYCTKSKNLKCEQQSAAHAESNRLKAIKTIKWFEAVAVDIMGSLSYKVKLKDGRFLRCHQNHFNLRRTSCVTFSEGLIGTAGGLNGALA